MTTERLRIVLREELLFMQHDTALPASFTEELVQTMKS